MLGRLLYYMCPALLVAAALGCDHKPPPPKHRIMQGDVSGDFIAGTPVTSAPAVEAPEVPEPPGATGPAGTTPEAPGETPVAGTPEQPVVEPPVVEPGPEGPGATPPGLTEQPPVAPPLDGLPQPPKLPDAEKRTGYVSTNFDLLSGYEPGPLGVFGASPKILKNIKLESLVPQRVLDLNDKKVGITGYMIPVDFDKNEVLTFLLCRWQPGCCFGHVPKAHEQIYVEAQPGSGTRFVIVPVTAYGKLLIGPKKDADGKVVEDGGESMALYRLLADQIDVPKDW